MIESRRRYQSNMRETPYHLRGRRGRSHLQSWSKPSLASAAQRSTNLTTSRYAQPSSVVGSPSDCVAKLGSVSRRSFGLSVGGLGWHRRRAVAYGCSACRGQGRRGTAEKLGEPPPGPRDL